MRKLNYLLLFVLAALSAACSTEEEEPKLIEKNVTIEIELGGDYSDYLVTFTVHSMLSGTSTFVAPVLKEPSSLDWTQVVEQGNTYTLTFKPAGSLILVNSSSPIHSLGFLFNVDPLDREPEESVELLTATIRVLADGKVYREHDFEALPSDKTSVPISESVTIE